MGIVESIVNAPLKDPLSEPALAVILKSGEMDPHYLAHLCNFFTDVPVAEILRFAKRFGIPMQTLKQFYFLHIREYYPNPDLEEVFD